MNLHEYQGKSILKGFGVAIPYGIVASSPEAAVEAAKEVQKKTGSDKWAVKAQIHAGGRGKGGGVKIAKSLDEVKDFAKQILGMMLVTPQTSKEGKLVSKIIVEQNIYYAGPDDVEEYYMSILLNRDKGQNMVMYSPRGGMNIEQVAEETPEEIFTELIDPKVGLTGFQARRIAFNLGLSGVSFKEMTKFVAALYKAYVGSDASLFEINPVIKAADGKVYAADAKRVEEAFRIILKDPNVEAILVNIFGGIVRCDRVAQGVVDAYNNIGDINVPIIVRLQGTNAEEGKELIDASGLKVHSAIQLEEAAGLVNSVLK